MPTAANTILLEWNRLGPEAAADVILPCNGSRAWAAGVASRSPVLTSETMFAASDEVWLGLNERDWQQAFDSHPRIGERHAKAATAESAAWSAGEQSRAQADAATAAALTEANLEYERRFGRIFIVCATGKRAQEILRILHARIKNSAAAELQEAAEQQREITRLRLRKWLQIPLEAC